MVFSTMGSTPHRRGILGRMRAPRIRRATGFARVMVVGPRPMAHRRRESAGAVTKQSVGVPFAEGRRYALRRGPRPGPASECSGGGAGRAVGQTHVDEFMHITGVATNGEKCLEPRFGPGQSTTWVRKSSHLIYIEGIACVTGLQSVTPGTHTATPSDGMARVGRRSAIRSPMAGPSPRPDVIQVNTTEWSACRTARRAGVRACPRGQALTGTDSTLSARIETGAVISAMDATARGQDREALCGLLMYDSSIR